jgi:hypothetical protein
MIKVGTASGSVLVTLSPTEFSGLAGQSYSDTPDGSNISLSRIKQMSDMIDNNKSQLKEVKQKATDLAQTISGLI